MKVDGELRRLEEDIALDKKFKHDISIVVDRLVMRPDLRRVADSIETWGSPTGSWTSRWSTAARSARTPSASPACGTSMPEARAADVLVQLAPRRVPAMQLGSHMEIDPS